MSMEEQMPVLNFDKFVLSTCVPSHVRAARKGLDDWVAIGTTTFASPSSGLIHECDPRNCAQWVIRFVDGVRICAISGRMLLMDNNSPSPKKRELFDAQEDGKRHQNKPIPGSSAYLEEKFGVDSDFMQVEPQVQRTFPRLNQYPYN